MSSTVMFEVEQVIENIVLSSPTVMVTNRVGEVVAEVEEAETKRRGRLPMKKKKKSFLIWRFDINTNR